MAEDRLSRRAFLIATAGAGIGAAAGAVAIDRLGDLPAVELPPAKLGLPVRQHAWNAVLRTDACGTPQLPVYNRLVFFDLAHRPNKKAARYVEAALRHLESRFAWDASGLLFEMGWGPAYFNQIGVDPPIPKPTSLSDFETPELDAYGAVLHLSSDDADTLDRVQAALTGGAHLPGLDGPVDLRPALRWRETRTGFTGPGIPAAHQNVRGIPETRPVPPQAPLFMGFKSGFHKNQATEDDVTIPHGPLAGGTTLHASISRLDLSGWYRLLDQPGRVARMFAPQLPPPKVDKLTDEAPTFAQQTKSTARQQGLVGHLQLAARARRNNRPVILRRDFDTVDGGQAGLHFVSLQRSIQDFIDTRKAMNGAKLVGAHPALKPRVNNGIKEFFIVRRRANYLIPPRPQRAYPLLPGSRT